MSRGFIVFQRGFLDSEAFLDLDPNSRAVFVDCVRAAAWKPTRIVRGERVVELGPGQLITSRRRLAGRCRISERQVRTALDCLERAGFVSKVRAKKASTRATILTIEHWRLFQGGGNQPRPQSDQDSAEGRPEGRPDDVHIEERKITLKNFNNIKKGDSTSQNNPNKGDFYPKEDEAQDHELRPQNRGNSPGNGERKNDPWNDIAEDFTSE